MSRNSFKFKRFTVEQEGCAMKVGTDGVLLGAWCRIRSEDKAILDIGTGTGVIALQLAQRTEGISALIEAVEPDPASAGQARRNFEASGWGSRLELHGMTVQEFARTVQSSSPAPSACNFARFDHIVSNPPYFIGSLASPDPSRTAARHANTLPYNEFIAACDTLLKPDGVISLILPAGFATDKMTAGVIAAGFGVTRRTEVHSTPKSGPKRLLLEFSRQGSRKQISAAGVPAESLVIEDAGPGTFSAEYRALTRDFYLYF